MAPAPNGPRRPQSDLDMVVFATPEQNSRVSDLREAFEESNLPFRVDLFIWDEVPEQFRKQIEAEHAVLVGRKKQRFFKGWQTVALGDCAMLVRETVLPSDLENTPYVGLEHIGENTLSLVGYGIASDVTSAKTRFRYKDILFGKLRPYFRKVVRARFDGICSTDIWVVRAKEGVDQQFLFYHMASQSLVDFATSASEGTRMPRAKWDYVSRYELPIPPLSEQRAIAHILDTLDDKIELNRRMNQTLEEMARALFKSWFVDFLPVRAKQRARTPACVRRTGRQTGDPVRAKAALITPPPEGSDWTVERARAYLPAARGLAQAGLDGMDASIADLFPDRLVDSELGPIPEGWEVGVLDDAIELLSGGTPRTSVASYWGGDIPWYTAKDAPSLSDVFVLDTERTITQAGVENSATNILPFGTTIITARGTVGRLACLGVPMAINQTCYGIRGARGYPNFFTYWNVRRTVDELQVRTHGTIFDTITRQTFKLVETALPPSELAEAFELTVTPVMRRILCNLLESRTLATLRDALLPKLVSGKLRVGGDGNVC